jgi:hypothetical protein
VNRVYFASTLSLASICACAASPADLPTQHDIEVRPTSTVPVSGTAFTCTAHPASVLTPCDEFSEPRHGTSAFDVGDGIVDLGMSRSSNAADGGEVVAHIKLTYLLEGELLAAAQQVTSYETSPPGGMSQDARAGWIEPVAKSVSAAGRNAGRFSLTFDWGTMSGAYDSDD